MAVLGVLVGFTTIGAVIAVGALVAHLGLLGADGERTLNQVAFYVASPALLLTTVARADVRDVLSRSLGATAAGTAAAALVYVLVAVRRWRRSTGGLVIGALAGSFVNSGNLGIPIAAYVLGDAAFVAPTILLQQLVLQPLGLALLDADQHARRISFIELLWRPFTNPVTIGALSGLVLAVTGWRLPDLVLAPVELVAALAVPAMLLAYGVALRLGPGVGGGVSRAELTVVTIVKMIVQPLVVWLVASQVLELDGLVLLAVVVCAALPTAQTVYVFASRYDRSATLARDAVLITTTASVPVVSLIVATLG